MNVAEAFDGYKPMTDEAVLSAAPDLILMMDRGGDHAILNAELWAMPAIAPTPAAAARRVVRMDGLYLLGFGPRTGQAALDLHAALYGGLRMALATDVAQYRPQPTATSARSASRAG